MTDEQAIGYLRAREMEINHNNIGADADQLEAAYADALRHAMRAMEAQARVRELLDIERINERLPMLERSRFLHASQNYELGRLDMALLVHAALDGEGTK